MKIRYAMRLGAIVFIVTIGGCAAAGQHVANVYSLALIRAEERRELAEIRRDTRQELAEEEQGLARLEAERMRQQAEVDFERQRLEAQFCAANREALQDHARAALRDRIHSKVAFDVTHGLDVGELEVDVQELQRLLDERKRQPLQDQPGPRERLRDDCDCDDKECGCRSGLLRKHCGLCKHRRCQCKEETCGGPEALREALRQPRQPLRPTEIPMKLPVRLTFGIQQPLVEETRIRREALVEPRERVREGCDDRDCDHKDYDASGRRSATIRRADDRSWTSNNEAPSSRRRERAAPIDPPPPAPVDLFDTLRSKLNDPEENDTRTPARSASFQAFRWSTLEPPTRNAESGNSNRK